MNTMTHSQKSATARMLRQDGACIMKEESVTACHFLKNTVKLTLCSITAALSSVCMMFSYFPYLTYAVAVASGMFIMVPVIEINRKWAFLTFLTSSVLIFFLAEAESKLLYLCFLGYYPILKSIIEQIKKRAGEWFLKFLSFNIAVIVAYVAFAGMFGVIIDDFGVLKQYGVPILLVLGNGVFAIYDTMLSRLARLYMVRLHPKINRMLRKD